MRAVAYSIRSFEKEPLAKANKKKHDITLISNPLGLETAGYAEGKEAVIISGSDYVSEAVIMRLADLGVKYITVRAPENDKVDLPAAARLNITVSTIGEAAASAVNGPDFVVQQYDIAVGTIRNLDLWQDRKHTSPAPDALPLNTAIFPDQNNAGAAHP